MILVNLVDTREQEIPNIGYIFLEDEETGEQMLVNTSDETFNKEYKSYFKKRNDEMLKRMKKLKIDLIQVTTDEPFYKPLQKFFWFRGKRMVR